MAESARQLTPAEVEALREYAREKGRNWKAALLDDWCYARRPGILQSIRNEFGPSWLDTFTLED